MTLRKFAKGEVLDTLHNQLEICTSSSVRLGLCCDTVSGVVRCGKGVWQPVMLCGKSTAEKFLLEKILVLTNETFSQEEALCISWLAHRQFHEQAVQERHHHMQNGIV